MAWDGRLLSFTSCCTWLRTEAWRPLGFVSDMNLMSKVENTRQPKGASCRNMHRQLDVLLHGLYCVQHGQDDRLKNVCITLDDKQYLMDVICPILFIIGDGKSNDVLTGRYSSHTEGVKRHCRACYCGIDSLDHPYAECQRVTKSAMKSLMEQHNEHTLQQVSQYRVDNAFDRLLLPADDYGIWGATPTNLMHVMPIGIMKYCLEIIINAMPRVLRLEIDVMAATFHDRNRQSYRQSYPKTDFSKGVTNLTRLTADEICGLVFVLAALFKTTRGWEILELSITLCDELPDCVNASGVLEVLECLLCFWAWTRQHQFWLLKDDKTASTTVQHAMRVMLLKIKTQLPRLDGMGWKISKFHELLHLVEDMHRYGSPVNTSASSPEHNHLHFAKRPGRRAHKDHATFDLQVATRLTDTMILQSIAKLMISTGDDNNSTTVLNTPSEASSSVAMSSIAESISNATSYSLQIRD